MDKDQAWDRALELSREAGETSVRTGHDRRVFYVAEEVTPGDWQVVERKEKKGFWGWVGDIFPR